MPIPSTGAERSVRRLLRDDAHDAIREAIMDGTLAPGETLDDKALQQWLGLSRTPIRDALLRLEMEGLIEIKAQSKTSVAEATQRDVDESIQALGAIMGGVVRDSVPALPPDVRQHLVELTQAASAAVARETPTDHLERALGVYEVLLAHCPNRTLVRIARSSLVPLTFRLRSSINRHTPNWELLAASWARVREALLASDNVMAEPALGRCTTYSCRTESENRPHGPHPLRHDDQQ